MKPKFFFITMLLSLVCGVAVFLLPHPADAGYRSINQGRYIYHKSISPDEQYLAAIMGTFDNPNLGLYLIRLADGQMTTLVENDPTLEEVLWVPDGEGLLILREIRPTPYTTYTFHYLPLNGESELLIDTIYDSSARLAPENFISTKTGNAYFYKNKLPITNYDNRLYMASLPDGGITPIPEQLPEGAVNEYHIRPNHPEVLIYYRDESDSLPSRFILANLIEGTWTTIPALANIGARNDFRFTSTGRYVVILYAGDNSNDIYVYDFETEAMVFTVRQERGASGYEISSDGTFLLFTQRDENWNSQIYKYRFGDKESTLLYQTATGDIAYLWLAPNEHALVFYERDRDPIVYDYLYALRYDPAEPAILLHPTFQPTGDVFNTDSVAITPFGWVVFRTRGPLLNQIGNWLYGVPLDGNTPLLPIHPDPTVQQFKLDRSGTRVYYRTESEIGYDLITEPIIPNKEGPTPLFHMPPADNGPSIESILSDGRVLFRVHPDYYIADALPPILHWNDDGATGVEGFQLTIPAVLESASAIGTITAPIEIIGGTATEGQDYTLITDRLTIARGLREGTIALDITADGQMETDETIILQLGSPVGARLGEPRIITITLRDDLFQQSLPVIKRY